MCTWEWRWRGCSQPDPNAAFPPLLSGAPAWSSLGVLSGIRKLVLMEMEPLEGCRYSPWKTKGLSLGRVIVSLGSRSLSQGWNHRPAYPSASALRTLTRAPHWDGFAAHPSLILLSFLLPPISLFALVLPPTTPSSSGTPSSSIILFPFKRYLLKTPVKMLISAGSRSRRLGSWPLGSFNLVLELRSGGRNLGDRGASVHLREGIAGSMCWGACRRKWWRRGSGSGGVASWRGRD